MAMGDDTAWAWHLSILIAQAESSQMSYLIIMVALKYMDSTISSISIVWLTCRNFSQDTYITYFSQ